MYYEEKNYWEGHPCDELPMWTLLSPVDREAACQRFTFLGMSSMKVGDITKLVCTI